MLKGGSSDAQTPEPIFLGLVERKKFYMLDTRSIRRRRISLCATSLTHPSVAYVKKLFPFVNVSPQNKLELYKFQGGKEPAGPEGKLKLFLSVWIFVGKFTMFKRFATDKHSILFFSTSPTMKKVLYAALSCRPSQANTNTHSILNFFNLGN